MLNDNIIVEILNIKKYKSVYTMELMKKTFCSNSSWKPCTCDSNNNWGCVEEDKTYLLELACAYKKDSRKWGQKCLNENCKCEYWRAAHGVGIIYVINID